MALLAELEKRERRLNEINEKMLASTGNGLEAKLREIEEIRDEAPSRYSGTARRRCTSREIGAGETLHRHHAYAEREQLHGQRRLESIGRTFGWCRGRGMHDSATSCVLCGLGCLAAPSRRCVEGPSCAAVAIGSG